jgi:hypothetical protein
MAIVNAACRPDRDRVRRLPGSSIEPIEDVTADRSRANRPANRCVSPPSRGAQRRIFFCRQQGRQALRRTSSKTTAAPIGREGTYWIGGT